MGRVVAALHDRRACCFAPDQALGQGKLCVVDVSQMRGGQALVLSGLILQRIFEHNQDEFTKADRRRPDDRRRRGGPVGARHSASQGEGPYIAWVKEGRKYDLGAVLITQQPGSIPRDPVPGRQLVHLPPALRGDLRGRQRANAHFSDDLLMTLLNEPIPGHGVFWSSVSETPYPNPNPPRPRPSQEDLHSGRPALQPPARPLLHASGLKDELDNALSAAAGSVLRWCPGHGQ